jgi:hypothetical protein
MTSMTGSRTIACSRRLPESLSLIGQAAQRRLKWKNIGALIDDLESGTGTTVLGPVARDVVKTRLAEASLGLRPSIKSRPTRKRPSLIETTAPAIEPLFQP